MEMKKVVVVAELIDIKFDGCFRWVRSGLVCFRWFSQSCFRFSSQIL